MGASWSKTTSWLQGSSSQASRESPETKSFPKVKVDPRNLASQFVYTRKGSMFFDEDGDLAHEFYEEVKIQNSRKTVMQKRNSSLRPQGTVYYDTPRLHVDFPIIMYSPLEK